LISTLLSSAGSVSVMLSLLSDTYCCAGVLPFQKKKNDSIAIIITANTIILPCFITLLPPVKERIYRAYYIPLLQLLLL